MDYSGVVLRGGEGRRQGREQERGRKRGERKRGERREESGGEEKREQLVMVVGRGLTCCIKVREDGGEK